MAVINNRRTPYGKTVSNTPATNTPATNTPTTNTRQTNTQANAGNGGKIVQIDSARQPNQENIQQLDRLTPQSSQPAANTGNQGQSNPQQGTSPGYQSPYKAQLDNIMDQILNRGKFVYEFNQDPLFQYYSDLYQNQGQQAMQDVMGQVSAQTGGYGNSYGAAVGSQAYQDWLSKIYDKGLEFRDAAFQQYQAEGDELMNQWNALSQQDQTDYTRWLNQQQMDEDTRRWNEEMDRLRAGDEEDRRRWEAEMERLRAGDEESRRQFDVQMAQRQRELDEDRSRWEAEMERLRQQDEENRRRWEKEQERAERLDEEDRRRWEKEFNERVRQWEAEMAQRQRELDEDRRRWEKEQERLDRLENDGSQNAAGNPGSRNTNNDNNNDNNGRTLKGMNGKIYKVDKNGKLVEVDPSELNDNDVVDPTIDNQLNHRRNNLNR